MKTQRLSASARGYHWVAVQ